MTVETELENARAELDQADEAVRAAFRVWADEQVALMETFLEEEGRLTATQQAEHTESIADKIPSLRAEISRTARAAADHVKGWIESFTDDDVLNTGFTLEEAFNEVAATATQEFAKAMVDAGYDPGANYGLLEWGGEDAPPVWHFYRSTTGRHRTEQVPMPASANAYSLEVRARGAIAKRVQSLQKKLRQGRAADLWDSSAP